MATIYNFSSGPAMLPAEVLYRATKELSNWQDLGSSVMEISHRSKEFIALAQESEKNLCELLNIPNNYQVLFCQGGARGQFSAIPLNLLGTKITADYINGGFWAESAIKEAVRYCKPKIVNIATTCSNGLNGVKPMSQWSLHDDAAYVHYCQNETIEGITIYEQPSFLDKVVIADFSSSLLSSPIDISRYSMIYAGAQKNIGSTGLTLVIIRKDLLGRAHPLTPSIFNYKILADYNSMFNTPPTFAWYLINLIFKWLKEQGGLAEMEKRNKVKANLLYSFIDNSKLYYNKVTKNNRSVMNVPFQLTNPMLNETFLKVAKKRGLQALKGHSKVGGMRASIYNAMPLNGVKALVNFMFEFEQYYYK